MDGLSEFLDPGLEDLVEPVQFLHQPFVAALLLTGSSPVHRLPKIDLALLYTFFGIPLWLGIERGIDRASCFVQLIEVPLAALPCIANSARTSGSPESQPNTGATALNPNPVFPMLIHIHVWGCGAVGLIRFACSMA